MAASVRLEDETFSCMKYERLAEFAGLADSDHARGKMAKLWRQCTLEQRYVLPESDVVRVLGTNGARALHDAGLGEIVADGVRIRGTKGRIEWLKKLRANGKKGGRPKKPKGYPSGSGGDKPGVNPPAPAPAPALSPSPSPVLAREKKQTPSGSGELPRPAAPPSGDHQVFVADFQALFAEANDGAKPTWGAKQGAQVKALLAAHGLDECRKRAANMFRAPPDWPSGPYDLGTLSQHFDKFAQPYRAKAKAVPDRARELWDRANQLEAEENAREAK